MRSQGLSPGEVMLLSGLERALRAAFGDRLTGLWLFGSRARGEGRDDSDLDVLVDVRGVTPAERGQMLDLAADLGAEHDLTLSLLVRREDVAVPASILAGSRPLF